MSNEVLSTLKVYGNKIHADTARTIIEAVFGTDQRAATALASHEPCPGVEIGQPMVASICVDAALGLPYALAAELSVKLPELTFVLHSIASDSGVTARRVYRHGRILETAGQQSGPDGPDVGLPFGLERDLGQLNGVSSPCLLAVAMRHLNSHGILIAARMRANPLHDLQESRRATPYLHQCNVIKTLLNMEERATCDEAEQKYKLWADRSAAVMQAEVKLMDALEVVEADDVLDLLDEGGREAIEQIHRFCSALRRLKPGFPTLA